jgi:hypothetical protein
MDREASERGDRDELISATRARRLFADYSRDATPERLVLRLRER